ncbi:MAG: biotin--[acetyl-CoA-carboxylase] ligase [Xanthomonadales bacterium]|nr:biotin--[acetyl-CoA-carboxylase] ligase [Xanthomonadales bacterium]
MNSHVNCDPIHRLAQQLSHRESRSGASIAESLGVSRTAVWKHVETLRDLGIEVDAVAGQGYRLREPLELLDSESILSELGADSRSLLDQLHVLGAVDSTNDWLQARAPGSRHARAVVAEQQLAGKGRRGRSWVSPFGRNIYLSLAWRFELGVAEVACLPLVVAIAACEALESAGVAGVMIKWPNDLVLNGAKLGGCLVEVQGDAAGPCLAIMGVGINVRMGPAGGQAIDQPWTEAVSVDPGISRNRLAGQLLHSLLHQIIDFASNGFASFDEAWNARDVLRGRPVTVSQPGQCHHGIARGISPLGGLLLQSSAGVAEYRAGEVSIRQKEL